MHRRMRKAMNMTRKGVSGFLKSKTAHLTDEDKTKLDTFIENNMLTK